MADAPVPDVTAKKKRVAELQRETLDSRRRLVISTFQREFDTLRNESSAVNRLKQILPEDRVIVASGDVDGLVSAMILGAVTGWKVGAVVIGSQRLLLHPDWKSPSHLLDSVGAEGLFGVDVFSTLFANASNHPVLWGSRRLGRKKEQQEGSGALAKAYDAAVLERAETTLFLNPSLWAGIEASDKGADSPTAAMYRYPMGTAQFLLAALEAAGSAPRLFDRDYLPWLIAHCDGGVETIRRYPFNVPLWWSCMAAAVGPASLSESLYRLVDEQRANQFVDVDRRLRWEAKESAGIALTTDWNLSDTDAPTLRLFVNWLEGISGWPDPFRDGVEAVATWNNLRLARGVYVMSTLSDDGGISELSEHFGHSLNAIHTSFSHFDQKWRLGWMSTDVSDAPPLIGGKRTKTEEKKLVDEPVIAGVYAGEDEAITAATDDDGDQLFPEGE